MEYISVASGGEGVSEAPKHFLEDYHYSVPAEKCQFSGEMIPKGLTELYKHLIESQEIKPGQKYVTIGGDETAVSVTIPARIEEHSTLHIVWIGQNLPVHGEESVFRLLFGDYGEIKSNYKPISPSQMTMIGLNDLDDSEQILLDRYQLEYYLLPKIRQIGLSTIGEMIRENLKDHKIHLVMDLSCFAASITPATIRRGQDGFNLAEMNELLSFLAPNTVSMDLFGLNPKAGNEREICITAEVGRQMMISSMNIKEKSINIFTEESEFLVFRPLVPKDNGDIGWYILRGIPTHLKKELMSCLSDDQIISVELPLSCLEETNSEKDKTKDEDNSKNKKTETPKLNEDDFEDEFLVTKTTLAKQNEMFYYQATSMADIALFPQEKQLMYFELITPY